MLLDTVYPFPAGVYPVPHLDELGRDFRFKVPTLRNLQLTAPYLNDGTQQNLTHTLRKRIPFYVFGEVRTPAASTVQFGRESPEPAGVRSRDLRSALRRLASRLPDRPVSDLSSCPDFDADALN